MYQRTLAESVQEITKHFPVLLITGPRQVGKTTLFELCAESERGYVTLDDLDVRQLAKTDPGLFIQTYPPPIIIDEIQYAPELLSYIKIAVDQAKTNGLYWLTGSQKFNLMQGISESLAGRVAVLDLLGLSQAEKNNRAKLVEPFLPTLSWVDNVEKAKPITRDLHEVYQQIWLGSFPRLVDSGPSIRNIFYSSYVQTYIQRDVKSILAITDELRFYKFISILAARTGQILNINEVARDAEIDNKTAKAWLSLLETSGLIYLLKPYHSNLTKRLVKSPKLYFLDTGLCCYLTKWIDSKSLEAGALSGAILETYIVSELLKSYWHNGLESSFYYYRDFDQKEIDLIIETGDYLYPVEFKKSGTPSKSYSKNFNILEKINKKVGHGAIICFVKKPVPLSNNVIAIPIDYL